MNKTDFLISPYNGEMLPYERYRLHNWILEIKPKVVFEVGTGNGGGSTYYIANALKKLENGGLIYTCDPERKINEILLSDFKNITYYHKPSFEMLELLINQNIIPDFIMFDGPENPDIALKDIKFLEQYIDENTHFAMHDWDLKRPYDNGTSTKSVKIREYMENSENWVLLEILKSNVKNSDFDDLPYDSVGLCLYKYKK